jgi:hypothetical protein
VSKQSALVSTRVNVVAATVVDAAVVPDNCIVTISALKTKRVTAAAAASAAAANTTAAAAVDTSAQCGRPAAQPGRVFSGGNELGAVVATHTVVVVVAGVGVDVHNNGGEAAVVVSHLHK